MILTWLGSVLDWLQIASSCVFIRLKSTVLKILLMVIVFIMMLWASVFMYASFHYMYMPSNIHVRQVHFHYNADCDRKVTKLCSFPTANMSLLQRGQDQLLMPGQAYAVTLYLDMPESPVNQQLGMFLIKMELYSKQKVMLEQKRNSMIRFKSSLLQTIETLVNAPLYVFGVKEQKQELAIPLYEHFEDDAYHPIVGALIQIQSKNIEIYSAVLKVHAKLSGLRFLIYEYPVFSAFFGITSNLSFLLAVTLLSWYKITSQNSVALQEEKSVLTLEERRKALRATMHRERAPSTTEVPQTLPRNDSEPITLRKMYTSANRKNKTSEPEIISAGKEENEHQVAGPSVIKEQSNEHKSDSELRQRRLEANQTSKE